MPVEKKNTGLKNFDAGKYCGAGLSNGWKLIKTDQIFQRRPKFSMPD